MQANCNLELYQDLIKYNKLEVKKINNARHAAVSKDTRNAGL